MRDLPRVSPTYGERKLLNKGSHLQQNSQQALRCYTSRQGFQTLQQICNRSENDYMCYII
eukprot:4435790-Amphidinium_carterae.1